MAKKVIKEEKDNVKEVSKDKTSAKPKTARTTSKKVSIEEKAPNNARKSTKSSNIKKVSTTKKTSLAKSASTKKKTSSEKKVSTVKDSSTAKKTSSVKTRSAVKKASPTSEVLAKPMLSEYYDLPYRYNQTIVRILAQTPTTLFVYWDISDDDRASLMSTHGEKFFEESSPVLLLHNTTKNYSFEIPINDFANSWYIRLQEPDCDYIIELGRRFNNHKNEYIHISSSNDIISPNDHILFEKTNLRNILFRNVQTNKLSSKDFGNLKFINDMDKLYGNIYDIYRALYDDDLLHDISNPSSGEFYLNK